MINRGIPFWGAEIVLETSATGIVCSNTNRHLLIENIRSSSCSHKVQNADKSIHTSKVVASPAILCKTLYVSAKCRSMNWSYCIEQAQDSSSGQDSILGILLLANFLRLYSRVHFDPCSGKWDNVGHQVAG